MLNYPLNLSFKIIALAPQVRITDASGNLLFYVRQKILALKEDVKVFTDEQQQHQLYQIKADRVLDFSAKYHISISANGTVGGAIGAVKRQGMRSLWKATYNILDATGAEVGLIHEENPWLKVLDSILSEVPFLGMFINPAYIVELRGQPVLYMKKQPAVFEGKFTLEKRGEMAEADEKLLLPAVLMMLMLERSRG